MSPQGIRGLAGMKAALAIALAASVFAPASGNRRLETVPNAPGERLLPRRRKPLRQPDPERIDAAEAKRTRKADKRLRDRASGGWVAADMWLGRLELRQAMAAADRELEARLA